MTYEWRATRRVPFRGRMLWHITEDWIEHVHLEARDDSPARDYDRTHHRRLCRPATDSWLDSALWEMRWNNGRPETHPMAKLEPTEVRSLIGTRIEVACPQCLAKVPVPLTEVVPSQPTAADGDEHRFGVAAGHLQGLTTAKEIRRWTPDIRVLDPDMAADLERLATDFERALAMITTKPREHSGPLR